LFYKNYGCRADIIADNDYMVESIASLFRAKNVALELIDDIRHKLKGSSDSEEFKKAKAILEVLSAMSSNARWTGIVDGELTKKMLELHNDAPGITGKPSEIRPGK